MKPTLDLYIGKKVAAVETKEDGEAWQWAILLADGTRIVNKSREEVFPPTNIVGLMLGTITMSGSDTTIHFRGGMIDERVSFNPTQYAILDPRYGGEAYPQWPEELEEAGIPSHPEEDVSAQPKDDWPVQRSQLQTEQHKRQNREQKEWMEGDQSEN